MKSNVSSILKLKYLLYFLGGISLSTSLKMTVEILLIVGESRSLSRSLALSLFSVFIPSVGGVRFLCPLLSLAHCSTSYFLRHYSSTPLQFSSFPGPRIVKAQLDISYVVDRSGGIYKEVQLFIYKYYRLQEIAKPIDLT